MSEPLSIYALVINASVLVQIIMALLVAASMASWVMIFQRCPSYFRLVRDALYVDDQNVIANIDDTSPQTANHGVPCFSCHRVLT